MTRHSGSDPRTTEYRPAADGVMDTQQLTRAYQFFNEIGIIAQLATNQMQRRLPYGLSQAQFSVLNWFIRVDSQASPGRLARAFQVTPGAMTNTLSKLAEKGFVSIADDPDSGRSKIVTLTESGAAAREDAVAASYPLLREFLEQFDAELINSLLPTLAEVRSYLDARRDSERT